MLRGIALVGWVATVIAVVAGWPGMWLSLDVRSLRVVVEEMTEEPPPTLVATTEVPEENIGLLRRGVLVEVGARPVGSIPRPHLRTARRTARGPPLVRRSVIDEVHDTENPDPKEKTC